MSGFTLLIIFRRFWVLISGQRLTIPTVFCGFPQYLQANAGLVTQIRP
jgi:hypothetical protein